MRTYHYSGLLLILFFVCSCSVLDNFNSSEERITSISSLETLNKSTNCPNYFIPRNTSILRNKKNEEVLKLYGVKVQCRKEVNKDGNLTSKIVITQTIYYQLLMKNLNLNTYKYRLYTALVDEEKSDIKFKILSKIRPSATVETKNKVFFKNTNTFKMNLYEGDNKLIFYYGFQS